MDESSLIISKDLFFKDNFNIDQCLSAYTLKTDLETLRKALRVYGNELHQHMSAILKNETEEIVNLAEYLTNLESKVEDLVAPVSQLKEEIKTLYELILKANDNYSKALDHLESNRRKRRELKLKDELFKSCLYIEQNINLDNDPDPIILERAVNKYAFYYIFLEQLGIDFDDTTINMGKTLNIMINRGFINAIKTNNHLLIARYLRMYQNMKKQSMAELVYRENIVRPKMKQIFNQKNLEINGQNLEILTNEAFDYLDQQLKYLQKIIEDNQLKYFNFALNSFWPEIDDLLRINLPFITAAGNPDLFQNRYLTTYRFLTKLGEKCGDKNLVIKDQSFKDHLERFNLPVYYEIRYQSIAGILEYAIVKLEKRRNFFDDDPKGWKLTLTKSLWSTVNNCFLPEVFIDELGTLKPEDVDLFAINSIHDMELLETFTNDMPEKGKQYLPSIFGIIQKKHERVVDEVKECLIKQKYEVAIGHLHQVTLIPRFYRRTNKGFPTTPSGYAIKALEPLLDFHKKFTNSIQSFDGLFDAIIGKITKEYINLVKEVQWSVCKTEKSLRRLKNRSLTSSEEFQQAGSDSDEKKINKQIELDVNYLFDKLHPKGLEGSKSALNELKMVLNERYET